MLHVCAHITVAIMLPESKGQCGPFTRLLLYIMYRLTFDVALDYGMC